TVGDLWAGVREGPGADLGAALDALGVEVEEDDPVRGPLPRTAAPDVRGKTSDEIALASKDPALFEYVRRRAFGPEGTTEPAPGARVRVVQGHDPGGSLRRGRGPHLRRWLVRADRVDRHEGLVPAPRAALSGARVPLREDPHRLARVPRLEPDRAADRLPSPVHADVGGGRRASLRRSGMVVRAQARRDPLPRRDDDRGDRPSFTDRSRQ